MLFALAMLLATAASRSDSAAMPDPEIARVEKSDICYAPPDCWGADPLIAIVIILTTCDAKVAAASYCTAFSAAATFS